MIRFENVSKRYLNGHEALSQINFHIERGEMAFLTGHSGAGKSTLLKLLTLMERSSHGQVWVNNHDFSSVPRHRVSELRRNTGIIFQNPRLLKEHTIFDNVALPMVIAGYRYQEIGRRVRAALDKVGLLKKERLYPNSLSCGEQQRIGIARAVVNKPPLLLADEPTGNLDPGLSAEIMRLFEEFNRVGVSILVATHDLQLIGHLKHRILTLHEGRMVSTGVRFTDNEKV